MALTVVPESKSTGQMFAQQLATGLGGELGKTAAKGIGAGLGALGTGLGQMTGLIEKPKQLTEDMLIKAGFTPEDARLIVNSPPALQAKLIDAISQREQQHDVYQKTGQPEQEQMPQEGEQPSEMSQSGEEAPQPDRAIKTHPAVQRALDKVEGKRSETRPSALFGRTKAEANRLEHVKREDESLVEKKAANALTREKFEHAKEEPTRKENRDMVKTWRKEARSADKAIHALDQSKILASQGDFTPHTLRRLLTKAGFGDFFLGAGEESYKKIVQGLVMDKARELASAGKITAAILDKVQLRYPALENTPEGRTIMANLLSREAEESKVYYRIYKELKREGKWLYGKEPLDLVEQIEDLAEPEIEKMRKASNAALAKEIGLDNVPQGKRIVINESTDERGYMDDTGKFVAL